MLQQEKMIERVKQVCCLDERLVAAMMYGSFAQGEGDEFSDIEFILFFEDGALPKVDPEAWLSHISQVELYFVNEFGNGTAIFENLVRGEFHFDPASKIREINESWREVAWLPSLANTVILDRTGELSERLRNVVGTPMERDAPDRVRFLCNCFVNWMLMGSNLSRRGEYARALEFLGLAQRQLLWMSRLVENSTAHWPSPSKNLEKDLSEEANSRYASCTASLRGRALRRAYKEAWLWGREMTFLLAQRHGIEVPTSLYRKMDERFAA